jgi:hypothetical protein
MTFANSSSSTRMTLVDVDSATEVDGADATAEEDSRRRGRAGGVGGNPKQSDNDTEHYESA